jgi:hypothetical protein
MGREGFRWVGNPAAERAVLQSGQLLARFLNLFAFCKHSFTKRKQ